MAPRTAFRSAAALAAASALALAACVSDRPDTTAPVSGECRLPLGSPALGQLGTLVAIRDFAFQQAEVRIPAGATVTWLNCEPPGVDAHTATADDGAWGSGLLAAGAVYSRRFDEPGTYEYHCEPHPSMRAIIVVE